jgi:uncharacterized protein (TIGR02246 family)
MAGASNEQAIRELYHALLDRWNRGDANGMAELLAPNGNVVGFDGSQMNGRAEMAATLGKIFADHATATYTSIVREVRFVSDDVAILRAVVGMVPPGKSDINPAVNAVQSVVAVREGGEWRIALFHNTPAAYHGRPEESEALTEELRRALRE